MGQKEPKKETNPKYESILIEESVELILAVTIKFPSYHGHLGLALFLHKKKETIAIVSRDFLETRFTYFLQSYGCASIDKPVFDQTVPGSQRASGCSLAIQDLLRIPHCKLLEISLILPYTKNVKRLLIAYSRTGPGIT
jgi:hypothetical protein